MVHERIKFDDVSGTDTIEGFNGCVSVINGKNYVMAFHADEQRTLYMEEDTELEIVESLAVRKFHTPYATDIPAIDVHGEIRHIGQETPDNSVFFGYTKPDIRQHLISFMGIVDQHLDCENVEYEGELYNLVGEVDWDLPVLPLTPVDYVRIHRFDEPVIIEAGEFEGVSLFGEMVDARFGEAVELENTPDDFDDYAFCPNQCSDYVVHKLECNKVHAS